jgi:geranylgeranyl diphosphate synthase type I
MSSSDHADLRARIEKALSAFLSHQRSVLAGIDPALEPVADTIEAFVMGGGKRLRPAFAYWGFRGAGGDDSDELVAAVSSLELVQASALIHDDVMDASTPAAASRGAPPLRHHALGARLDGRSGRVRVRYRHPAR